ncbi:pneumococcal-type histidine triad protein, partial [Streptococcus iniae]
LLMTDPNYQLTPSDVISEMSEAAIIKVDDSYAVYVFPDSSRKNIRTKDEIAQEVAKANK